MRFLQDNSRFLSGLADLIQPHAKIGIDGLSDRLGNVLVQLPVTAVVTSLHGSAEGDLLLQQAWHPSVPERPLRVSCEMYEDATIEGFGSKTVDGRQQAFPLHSPRGGARYIVWDDSNEVIVGASAQTAFITSIGLNTNLVGRGGAAKREFIAPDDNGQMTSTSIALIPEPRGQSVIGTSYPTLQEPWRSARVFRESLHALFERKEFVQYGGTSGRGRSDALAHIRWLLATHGKHGAWLWDPYLDPKDVLSTLFFCPHPGADLRALSDGAEPSGARGSSTAGPEATTQSAPVVPATNHAPPPNATPGSANTTSVGQSQSASGVPRLPPPSRKAAWATTMEGSKGNGAGLKLEFRLREGGAGWPFHDRFLIFPGGSGRATAWSLGTSVNSLGSQHHILQEVPDGELISQAFVELWNLLADPDYLVWKKS